jgi:oligoribonuclease NrnB/cAMP/cGMP phosphodiesterase (DHH superfamily)
LGSRAEYLPSQHYYPTPDVAGKHVAIVDFSFKRPVLLEMMRSAKSLIVIDHHKTAAADLEGLDANTVFDMDKSGAVLSWEWFHPGTAVPRLLQFVQDRDIWTWRLPGARAFLAGLDSVPMTFEAWDAFADPATAAEREATAIADGTAITRALGMQIDAAVKNAALRTLGGEPVWVVNASANVSDVGNVLAKREDGRFALVFTYDLERKCYKCSLRAFHDGVDVSEVAGRYGGGGHAKASGFTFAPASGCIEELFDTA